MRRAFIYIFAFMLLSAVLTADNTGSDRFMPAMVSIEQEGETGIYQWRYNLSQGSAWEKVLEGVSADRMMQGDITGDGSLDLVVWFSDGSLYIYDITGNCWDLLCGPSAGLTAFTLAQADVSGTFRIIISNSNAIQGIDTGINCLEYGTGWHNISPYTASVMAGNDITADGTDELVFAFSGIEGTYVYDFDTGEAVKIAVVSPSQVISADITGDGYDEASAVFPGLGVYLIRYVHDKNNGSKLAIGSPFDPERDIKENYIWVSGNKSGKGIQFNRLTLGVPDEATSISAGDITEGTGKELFIAYQGRTSYFCYDTMSWTTLIHMPFKTMLAGRFTNHDKDDLLACASASGDIWLRHADNTWEYILPSGDTNAMSVIISASPASTVPQTGQKASYRSGDDGYYQAGVQWPDPRFTDNGDGTVTDNLTGLMWTQDADINGDMTWDYGIHWCNVLDHAGYSDWRMPNMRELLSLLDMGKYSPGLPDGHPFTDVQTENYWSSSTYAGNNAYAWYVYIKWGESLHYDKTDTCYVWAVRGVSDGNAPIPVTGQTTSYCEGDDGDYQMGTQWPDPRFTDNGDGTVTDNLTGLMWTRDADIDGKKTRDGAIDYCNALNHAGHNDWRLPNIMELNSLIDLENYYLALPDGHPFTGVQALCYWTSTTFVYYEEIAWGVYPHDGCVDDSNKSNTCCVWPVRGGQ